ncbi:hypothetical protein M9458_002727, partial [Cirrhinus mrigala]
SSAAGMPAAVPPEVVAEAAEPHKTGTSALAPCTVVAPNDSHPACESSPCPIPAMEAIYELSVHPVTAMKAVNELSPVLIGPTIFPASLFIALSTPPWRASGPSAPPWWAPGPSAPPWWAPALSAPPRRASVLSAPSCFACPANFANFASFASVPRSSSSARTWPTIPCQVQPLPHSAPWGGGGLCHESGLGRFAIHITQTVAPHPGLRSPSAIALITCIQSDTVYKPWTSSHYLQSIRIRIRKSFIAKCAYTHKEFVLVTELPVHRQDHK